MKCPTQSKAWPVTHAVGGARKCAGQLQGRHSSKSTCTAVLISRLSYSWVIEHFPVPTQLFALCSVLVSHSIPYNPFTTCITVHKSEQKMELLKLSKKRKFYLITRTATYTTVTNLILYYHCLQIISVFPWFSGAIHFF